MTTPTLCQLPLVIGELLARNAHREARRAKWRRLYLRIARARARGIHRTHVARISPNETVESNLPLEDRRPACLGRQPSRLSANPTLR